MSHGWQDNTPDQWGCLMFDKFALENPQEAESEKQKIRKQPQQVGQMGEGRNKTHTKSRENFSWEKRSMRLLHAKQRVKEKDLKKKAERKKFDFSQSWEKSKRHDQHNNKRTVRAACP